MAIDDPVGIAIRQAKESAQADAYVPPRLVKFGLSAIAATIAQRIPFVANILTNVIVMAPGRFEERFLLVAEELDAQQKRIEDKIPDKEYYQSEEFQSLLILILERIHTTHDNEKLRRFGTALANSGSIAFQSDDRETYIRTLRDLGAKDLQVLSSPNLQGWRPHLPQVPFEYDPEVLSSLSRLAGLGLAILELKSEGPPLGPNTAGLGTHPLKRIYYLSSFGENFLKFIGGVSGDTEAPL